MKELILKNVISNESSFQDSKTAIGLVASKRVQNWSQILILSPGWPCKQNEVQIKLVFSKLSRKMLFFFLQTNLNIGILYIVENHFSQWLTIRDCYLKTKLVWLRSTVRVSPICMETCVVDLGLFVANGGYQYDEKVERKLWGPWTTVKSGRRPALGHCLCCGFSNASTTSNSGVSQWTELIASTLASSGSPPLTCVWWKSSGSQIIVDPFWCPGERETYKKKESWGERRREGRGERGGVAWGSAVADRQSWAEADNEL